MAEHRLQIFEDDGGLYRWREVFLYEGVWEILAESEHGYVTKAEAIDAARQSIEIVDLDDEFELDLER